MKKVLIIIQWFFAVTFALLALCSGSLLAGVLIFAAAVLIAPIKPIRELLSKLKIKSFVAVILSIVLLFTGFAFMPEVESPENLDNSINAGALIDDTSSSITTETTTETTTEESITVSETTTEESTTEEETTTKKAETTTKKETITKKETTTKKVETTTKKVTTTANPDSRVTVYYTKTGKKYHYENPCGNGTYYSCTLAEAKERNLSPCEKCVLH